MLADPPPATLKSFSGALSLLTLLYTIVVLLAS